MKKKFFIFLMATVMCVNLLPITSFAAETDPAEEPVVSQEEVTDPTEEDKQSEKVHQTEATAEDAEQVEVEEKVNAGPNEIVISLTDASYTYDGQVHTLTPVVTAGPAGVTINDLPFIVHTDASRTIVGTSTATIEWPRPTSYWYHGTLYSVTYDNYSATLTINPKAATVTADAASKVYGEADPAFTATVEGLVGSDTILYSVSRTNSDENAGTYTGVIVPTGLATQGNYTVSYTAADFTINPSSALTVSGTSYSGVYDGATHGVAAVANVATGTTISYSTDGGNTWSTTVPTIKNAGTVNVMVKAENPNYVTATTSYSLVVAQKAVTVTAANSNKVYGEKDPVFTASVSGLLGSDTISYTVGRTNADENVGSYKGVIMPAGAASQGNYAVTYVGADFEITKADTLVVTATDYAGEYDGNAHGAAAVANVTAGTTISYSTDGGKTWTTDVPALKNAGSVKVSVKAENPNYNTATTSYTLSVAQKDVTVYAISASKTYGEKDPSFVAYVSGLVGTDTSIKYTITRTNTDELVGTYKGVLVPTGDASQGNYKVTYVAGDFTIQWAVVPSTTPTAAETAAAGPAATSPKTADSNSTFVWVTLMLAAFAGFVGSAFAAKKKNS